MAIAKQQGEGRDEALRYRPAGSKAVSDELTLQDPVELERLVAEVAIIARSSPIDAPPSRYVSMPLACVRIDNEAFVLTDYVPPCLAISRNHPIATKAVELASALRRKAHDGSCKLTASISQDQAGASAGWDWPAIRAMAVSLPRLEALLSAQSTNVYDLYLSLCDAAGALACLNRQTLPGQLPAYDHRDPGRAFSA